MPGSYPFKPGQIFLFGLIAAFLIGVAIYNRRWNDKFAAGTVYVLGKIDDIRLAKNGQNYHYHYYYRGERHRSSFNHLGFPGFRPDSSIVVKVATSAPDVCEVVYDYKIPICVPLDAFPDSGLKVLPKDTCK